MGDEFGVQSGEHIPGEVVYRYLTAYAKKWDLPKRISLRTTVTVVEKAEDNQGGYWRLNMRRPTSNLDDSPTEFIVTTKKLIVSTGITSNPHQPNFDGIEQFDAPIVHSAALGREQGRLFKNPDIRTVAILGGGKSAYDAVYLAACEGRTVVWLMRRSGRGPAWIFPPHTNIGPFKAWREVRKTCPKSLSTSANASLQKLVTRRVVSFFSPCIWGAVDGFGWIRRILHATRLGKLLSQKFWVNLHQSTLDECGYAEDERLRLLEPETR
jgi:cation diffusion facilitator CzcD-associated flavoprotein CzcO